MSLSFIEESGEHQLSSSTSADGEGSNTSSTAAATNTSGAETSGTAPVDPEVNTYFIFLYEFLSMMVTHVHAFLSIMMTMSLTLNRLPKLNGRLIK